MGRFSRFIPDPKRGGRHAKCDRREAVNALGYIARTDCQRRAPPYDLPSSIVYWYFRCCKKAATLHRLASELQSDPRAAEGRCRQPSAEVIHIQSAKTTERGGRTESMRGRWLTAAGGSSWSVPWA